MLARRAPALLLVGLLAGCATTLSCRSAGCLSSVTVDASALSSTTYVGATATLCVQDRCSSTELSADRNQVSVSLGEINGPPEASFATDSALPVRLTVTRSGATLLDATETTRLQRQAPNGERCGPVCWWAGYRLTSQGLVPMVP